MEKHNFTLDAFTKTWNGMVGTNDQAYSGRWMANTNEKSRDYTKEEIERIINNGGFNEKIELSRNYFRKDGFYRRILLHYATLMKYTGILIPNPSFGKKLSNHSIQKRYYNAMTFLDAMNIPQKAADWSIKAIRDGSYYGVIVQLDKQHFSVLDLPAKYCRSRFKDNEGNNIIEFNVQYFDSLVDQVGKEAALATYPEFITNYYKKWSQSKAIYESWCLVPTNIGVCFKLVDGTPMFLNVIPATIDYDDAVELAREREAEEIRKIIVQKIPHLSDGGLLFEPEEAAAMHSGAVGMMKGNKNISVLTTYADVEGIVSRTSADSTSDNLDKMVQNVYYQSGVSGQLFNSNSNLALSTSLSNDMALVMLLTKQYETFITSIINELYANGGVRFTYTILPITWYNADDYITNSFKLAASGYSFLLPALALGVSQKQLVDLKDLENDCLHLEEKLIPLSSMYTSTEGKGATDEGGAPEKTAEEKSDQTIANEKSLDQGGSN